MNEPTEARKHLVILDASVIINFLIINRWSLLLQNHNYRMASPSLVIEQITRAPRRKQPLDSVSRGELEMVDEHIPHHVLTYIPSWLRHLGQHDTAVLVNAIALRASIAADDRRLAKVAIEHGVTQVLTTEELLAEVVMQGQISILSGNQHLDHLRRERFNSKHTCLCHLCGLQCRCATP